MKFKVGDRVKIRQWGDMKKEFGFDRDGDIKNHPCFATDMKHLCGRTAKITSLLYDDRVELDFDDKTGNTSWYYAMYMLEPAENETIVIFRRGEEVIALDKRTDKRGVAKCSPEDKFDFMAGAKLRFERLTAEEKPKREYLQKFEKGKTYVFREKLHDEILGSSNWTGKVDGKIVRVIDETMGIVSGFDVSPRWCEEIELYNGKVVCVKNSAGNEGLYTVGRIYEFKDGVITVDNGVEIDKGDEPFASFEEFNSFSSSEFIEVVE